MDSKYRDEKMDKQAKVYSDSGMNVNEITSIVSKIILAKVLSVILIICSFYGVFADSLTITNEGDLSPFGIVLLFLLAGCGIALYKTHVYLINIICYGALSIIYLIRLINLQEVLIKEFGWYIDFDAFKILYWAYFIVLSVLTITLAIKYHYVGKNKNSTDQFKKTDYNPYSSTYKQESKAIEETSSPTVPLLRRAEIFLEDGDFNSADEYFNRVLDMDPECAKAYIGRLLVELKLKNEDELASCAVNIVEYGNYKKAVRFADYTYKEKLDRFNPEVWEKKENDRKEKIYKRANDLMNSNLSYLITDNTRNAAKLFKSIIDYKDSASLADLCDERFESLQIQNEKEKA